MKKIRNILFIFIILLMTGCSVEYNLSINGDDSITEKVVATEKTKKMESLTRRKGKNAVSYLYDIYNRDDSSNIVSKVEGSNTIATVTASHKDIDEYAKNFSSDIFDKVNVSRKNDEVTITAVQKRELGGMSSYSPLYDSVEVKIKVPYIVTDNNADKIEGSVYVWNINKEQDLKKIKITYKEDSRKNSVNLKIKNKTYNINYGILIVSGIIILLLIIFIIIYFKNKKNNIIN